MIRCPLLAGMDYADDEVLPDAEEAFQPAPSQPSTAVTITVQTDTAALPAGAAATAVALVTITADDPDHSAAASIESVGNGGGGAGRTAVDLIATVDVSGSMQGQKLELLRSTLLAMVEQLGPADRLSIVQFESAARRLTPLSRMTESGRATARAAIDGLSAGGGTNIGAALREAAAVVRSRRARNSVCHIVLLSDGRDDQAGAGPRCEALAQTARAEGGARVTALGYGADHDARMLRGAASAGGGDFVYVERPAAVCETVGRCLGGLLSVAAQAVRLRLAPLAGAAVAAVAADGPKAAAADGAVDVDMGELCCGETRDVLVDLALPPAAGPDEGAVCLRAEVTWLTPGAQEAQRQGTGAARLVIRRSAEGVAADPDPAAAAAAAAAGLAIDRQRNRFV